MASILAVIEAIGGVVGVLMTLIAFFGLILKKPKETFRKIIREESAAANQGIETQLDNIEKRMDEADKTDVVALRHSITNLYNQYKDKEEIPQYAKADWLSLYERYEKLGGNSYVHSATDKMKTWKEI